MTTVDAIRLAKTRHRLARLLGVTLGTTYRWKPDLPKRCEDRLRELRPHWFRREGDSGYSADHPPGQADTE